MKWFYYIFLLSYIFPGRGDIHSIEFLDYKTVGEIQIEIDQDLGDQGISITPEYDVSLYKIIYETLDGYGDTTLASGVVGVPQNSNYAFGIVSWQHGTVVKRNSVSSVSGFNLLSMILSSAGYVYVEPDYLGLGVSEDFHPYCLNIPSANTVVDMIRATRNFCNNSEDIQLNEQLSLIGYSEGGYATLAAQKMMEEDFSDEFEITISLPMAGPYDMSGTMVDVMLNNMEPYGKPYYLPYVLLAYIEYYSLGALEDFFLSEYAEMLPVWFDGYHSDSYIDSQLPNPPIQILLPSLIEEFESNEDHFLRIYLQNNDLINNWAPQSLTYLFHALADELIPFENAQIAYDNFIANGSENINLVPIPESYGGHQEAAPFALITGYQLGLPLQNINPKGDVNNDEQIDVSDVIIIVSYIMESMELNNYLNWASDMNGDNILDILDIVDLINNILE